MLRNKAAVTTITLLVINIILVVSVLCVVVSTYYLSNQSVELIASNGTICVGHKGIIYCEVGVKDFCKDSSTCLVYHLGNTVSLCLRVISPLILFAGFFAVRNLVFSVYRSVFIYQAPLEEYNEIVLRHHANSYLQADRHYKGTANGWGSGGEIHRGDK